MIRADLWRCVRRIICRHSKCRIVYIKVKTVFGLWWCPAVNLPDFQSPFSTTGLSAYEFLMILEIGEQPLDAALSRPGHALGTVYASVQGVR